MALIVEHAVFGQDVADRTGVQRRVLATEGDEATVERENRAGLIALDGDAEGLGRGRCVMGSQGDPVVNPALAVGSQSMGCAFGIATHADAGLIFLGGVLHLIGSDDAVRHAKFVAVVEGGACRGG